MKTTNSCFTKPEQAPTTEWKTKLVKVEARQSAAMDQVIEVVEGEDRSVSKQVLWIGVSTTACVMGMVTVAYFSFRIYTTVYLQIEQNPTGLALAWIFIVMELFMLMPNFLVFICRASAISRSNRPKLLVSRHPRHQHLVPSIDILILSCGEDRETILNTVRGAVNSNYPPHRLRVILSDDGKSQELASSVAALKTKSYPNVYYTSRKGDKKDFKAGNLNHALRFGADLAHSSSSDFVAVLDADMIFDPNALRAMLSHFMLDPQVGIVCPPQHFFNISINDRLRQDLDYNWHMINQINDALGSADCVGSGYLVRRTALNHIGGFPTFSVAEDAATSAMICSSGWKAISVNEHLQCGEQPDSMLGHIKQRVRWNLGNIQTAKRLKFRFSPSHCAGLKPRQRLAGLSVGATAVGNTLLIVPFIGLPLALLSGYPFVVYSTAWQLSWLIRLASIFCIINTLHQALLAYFVGFRTGLRYDQAEMWLAPYYFISAIRCFILPMGFGGTTVGFKATGSVRSELNERDPARRAPFHRRARTILISYFAWVHAAFLILCAVGVALSLVRCFDVPAHIASAYGQVPPLKTSHGRWVYLITRLGWPPVYWLCTSWSCLTPLRYMARPPDRRTEEDVLVLDEKTGVRYPRKEERDPKFTRCGRLDDMLSLAIGIYSILCFIASWYV